MLQAKSHLFEPIELTTTYCGFAEGRLLAASDNIREAMHSSLAIADETVQAVRKMKPLAKVKCIESAIEALTQNQQALITSEIRNTGLPVSEITDQDFNNSIRLMRKYAALANTVVFKNAGSSSAKLSFPVNGYPLLSFILSSVKSFAMGHGVFHLEASNKISTGAFAAKLLHNAGFPSCACNIMPVDHLETIITQHHALEVLVSSDAACAPSAGILFEDADIHQAVEFAFNGVWRNTGWRTWAPSVLWVQESVAADVVKLLQRKLEQVRIGAAMDYSTELCIGAEADDHLSHSIMEATTLGAQLYFGKSNTERNPCVEPSLLAMTTSSMTIANQSIKAPLLVLSAFRTHDEGLSLLNAVQNPRLCVAAWTNKADFAEQLEQVVKAKNLFINSSEWINAL